ncbi:probable F-actin-capping protein subunit beta [Tanacetum coccineum]|uniref:F-actin-capping protein subunit beta n=1 Tax=Tanacetum coccineum TaxID=301880 RepID=A0ABQ4Z320_9ASTR
MLHQALLCAFILACVIKNDGNFEICKKNIGFVLLPHWQRKMVKVFRIEHIVEVDIFVIAVFLLVQYAFCRNQICSSEVLSHTACNCLPWMHPSVEPVLCDEDSGKEFILCEYNRDADSYRSPWSNKFHPHLEDGMYPLLVNVIYDCQSF